MAYELFEELSTCDLNEIYTEELEKIINDCQNELTCREKVIKKEAVEKFQEAFTTLMKLGVSVECLHDTKRFTLYQHDIFKFHY